MIPEDSHVGEIRSSGTVENCMKQVQGQVRTFRLAESMQRKIDLAEPIWSRVIEYAAHSFNRFRSAMLG